MRRERRGPQELSGLTPVDLVEAFVVF